MSDLLPPNVRAVADRHGKVRYRFRRAGWPSAYLPGQPGTPDFHKAYAALLERGPREVASAQTVAKAIPRSLDDLVARSRLTTRWQRKAASTRRVQTRVMERFTDRKDAKGRRYGERPVTAITVTWLDRVFATMAETPQAANVLRKVLAVLLDEAIRMGWRTDNPVRLTETYPDGKGFHTWSEAEIAQFRATHGFGTMARLVLELTLNTSARRCNVATLTRDNVAGGRIRVDHAKGSDEASVPMSAGTREALEALPAAPIRYLITTVHGQPFSVAGLGNRMRKWCDEAGLPQCSMHGLRKALARRVAESGGTDAEGQAVTGHKKAQTFIGYRAKANRANLADRALERVSDTFDSPPTAGPATPADVQPPNPKSCPT